MDIVVTGCAGFEGSRLIYNNASYRERLLKRYSAGFFGVFENAAEDPLAGVYEKFSENALAADGSDGGVLAALWNTLKANHTGGVYSLKRIPVLQQTIEVCEMFSLNPYRLYSPGCRVWLTDDTGALLREAAPAGVPLSVIGFTSKGAAIRRMDTEGDSSLRRPERDELSKLINL